MVAIRVICSLHLSFLLYPLSLALPLHSHSYPPTLSPQPPLSSCSLSLSLSSSLPSLRSPFLFPHHSFLSPSLFHLSPHPTPLSLSFSLCLSAAIRFSPSKRTRTSIPALKSSSQEILSSQKEEKEEERRQRLGGARSLASLDGQGRQHTIIHTFMCCKKKGPERNHLHFPDLSCRPYLLLCLDRWAFENHLVPIS